MKVSQWYTECSTQPFVYYHHGYALYNIIKIKFRINTIKYIYSNHMSTGLIPPGSNIYSNNPTQISSNFDKRIIETAGVPF